MVMTKWGQRGTQCPEFENKPYISLDSENACEHKATGNGAHIVNNAAFRLLSLVP